MILYLLNWSSRSGTEIYDIINDPDYSNVFGQLGKEIHTFLVTSRWMTGQLALTSDERKVQRMQYANLSKQSLSFVISKVCDYAANAVTNLDNIPDSLRKQIESSRGSFY
jgi:hypothetical protein